MMARMALKHTLPANCPDGISEANQQHHARELLLSTMMKLMALVVLSLSTSLHETVRKVNSLLVSLPIRRSHAPA